MKSVLTIATGKKIYIDMACNLAMSFLLWNKENGLEFYLVTDNAQLIPKKIRESIKIIEIDTAEYDTGFAIKLYLDKFIRTEQTLFIDCDCLVYGDLNPVFEKFEDKIVSVIGENKLEGEFFGDILSVRTQFDLTYLPKFVGAIYYVKKDQLTNKIFEFARNLKPDYDKIGLVRLRGIENEEPLMAIAMAKFNQKSILDSRDEIKADKMYYGHQNSNVLQGAATMWNQTNELIVDRPCKVRPIIIHYCGPFVDTYNYKADESRLHLHS